MQVAKKHRRRSPVETATDAQQAPARKLAETRRDGRGNLSVAVVAAAVGACPARAVSRREGGTFRQGYHDHQDAGVLRGDQRRVTQSMEVDLKVCSKDCADDDACVGFNHLDPQLVCVKFQNPLDTVLLADGCTHYEVSHTHSNDSKLCRNICTAVLYRATISID